MSVGYRWLIAAAWVLFLLDAAELAVFAIETASADPFGRAIGFGVAQLALIPLGGLAVLLGVSTTFRTRIGLWVAIALAAAPLVYAGWTVLRDLVVL